MEDMERVTLHDLIKFEKCANILVETTERISKWQNRKKRKYLQCYGYLIYPRCKQKKKRIKTHYIIESNNALHFFLFFFKKI